MSGKKRNWGAPDELSEIAGEATTSEKKPTPHKKKNTMKPYIIKMDEDFHEKLKNHFSDKGINFSAGVRMILHQYASEERI